MDISCSFLKQYVTYTNKSTFLLLYVTYGRKRKKHFPNKNRVNQNCCFLLDLLFSTKYVFVNIHKQNLYIDLVGRGI